MGRGQKTCKKCGSTTGPRAFKCPSCGEAFEFKDKVPSIFKPEKGESVFDWKTLIRGDRIRVIAGSGPYYPKNAAREEDIPMGYYGKFTVRYLDEDGIHAYGNAKEGEQSHCYIFMNEEASGPSKTGMMRVPHKIVKLRKKERV